MLTELLLCRFYLRSDVSVEDEVLVGMEFFIKPHEFINCVIKTLLLSPKEYATQDT